MAGVFINYRRDEEGDRARRLYEVLCEHLGTEQVFIDAEMRLGVDFHEELGAEVGRSNVVVAVMGRDWTDVKAEDGTRALDDPRDWVRVELEAALERSDVRVIPVLVGGAAMPREAELPPSLRPLVRRQGSRLRYDSFDQDAERLAERIAGHIRQLEPGSRPTTIHPPVPRPAHPSTPARRMGGIGPAGAALLGAALAAWPAWRIADAARNAGASDFVENPERIVRFALYRGVFWLIVAAAAAGCAAYALARSPAAAAVRAGFIAFAGAAIAGALTQAFRIAESEGTFTNEGLAPTGQLVSFLLLGAIIGASGVAGTASATTAAGGLLGGLLAGLFARTDADPFVGALVAALLIVGGATAGAALRGTRPAGFEPATSRSGGERSIH